MLANAMLLNYCGNKKSQNPESSFPDKHFTSDAIDKLKQHSSFGNIRELDGVIERAFLGSENEVTNADELFVKESQASTKQPDIDLKDIWNRFRYEIVEFVIQKTGSASKAAELLKISPATVSGIRSQKKKSMNSKN